MFSTLHDNYGQPLSYFEEIVKPVYTGLEFASTTSMYRKLVVNGDYRMSYREGEFYCSSELIPIAQM